VKVWVLTGDKMTTAIEIGRSCELLTPDLSLIVLEAEPPEGDPGHGVSVAERLATAHRKALYKRLGEGFNPSKALRTSKAGKMPSFGSTAELEGAITAPLCKLLPAYLLAYLPAFVFFLRLCS